MKRMITLQKRMAATWSLIKHMFAYTPGNIVYGSDLSRVGDPAAAHISVTDLGALGDPNILDFFIPCAIGMRAHLHTLTETIMAIDLKECNARQLDSLEEMFSSALNQVRQEKEDRHKEDIQ